MKKWVDNHWNAFVKTIDNKQSQGKTGAAPSVWVESRLKGLADIPNNLPEEQLCRADVRKYCQEENDVLFGYICAMAWGGQGMNHPKTAWENREKLPSLLTSLRKGDLSRCDAYNLFIDEGKNKIPGLGPAYFTKILYFFGTERSPNNCYIMDQWTGKSVNLLTGLQVVRMDGDAVSTLNTCGNYQAFCEEVDSIADRLNADESGRFVNVTGAMVEEWLFSEGGKNAHDWRDYVKKQFAYPSEPLRKRYPDIFGEP